MSAEPLVGRAAELERLEESLARVERQGFVAVEIAGEPGIGKTRLLAELADRADRRGHLVLAGAASELESDLPFWVFADALDEYVHGLPRHELDNLGPDARAELGHVLPSLLVLDDLHWADSGSLELLGSLLRRPPSARVLLAMAVRPRQAPALLTAPLERARRGGVLLPLELSELTEEEAEVLLGGVAADAAARLYRQSGGNPFYLEQLRRSAGDSSRGGNSTAAPLALDVPPAVAASLAEELALLPALTSRILAGAAVAGDRFEPELAAAAADAG
jgi:predicted ATPase